MTGKLLQVVGVVTILGLLGGVAAGFGILKDRIRVVVQSDEADAGPNPTELLRSDVQILSEHLDGLQQAVASNFEQLATGLEGGAEERHRDVKALRTEVATLTRSLGGLQRQLTALEQRVHTMQVAAKEQAARAENAQPSEIDPPVEPVTQPVATVPTETETQQAEPQENEPTVTDEQPKKKRGGSFLSFTLPSKGKAFDEPQTFKLLPRLCRVGFDAKSTLHDFTGVTSDVSGQFQVDWDDPAGLCEGTVSANAKTLVTGVEGRDDNMYEHLDTEHHPDISFAIESFRAAEGGVDVKARTAKGEVVGKMTIRGKTRELTMPVEVSVDPQERLVVKGQVMLDLNDYEVPVPSQLGMINMEKDVNVWIALRARSKGDDK